MDLSWLEDYLCVVSEAHFARAAAARCITQSAITRHIKSLEYWVGEELLDRTQHPIRPTKAGELFIPVAKRMLEDAYGIRRTIRETRAHQEETIVFSSFNVLAMFELPRLIVETRANIGTFRSRVVTEIDSVNEYFSTVEDGRCDFFLCYMHPLIRMDVDTDRFERLDLRQERISPFASPSLEVGDFASADGPPIPMLRHSGTLFMRKVVDIILKNAACRARFDTVYEAPLTETLYATAQAGLGVTWLPESIVRQGGSSGALVQLGDDLSTNVTVTLFRSSRNLKPVAAKFWRFLSANVQQNPQPTTR